MKQFEDMIKDFMPMVQKAWDNWDLKVFRKWFGHLTHESDESVKLRYKRIMDFMLAKKRAWVPLCCKDNKGACNFCSPGSTVAYVNGGSHK